MSNFKTMSIANPVYVEQLERDNAQMRSTLASIKYIDCGPDKGSIQWCLDTAVSFATNTLLAVEQSRAGKEQPQTEIAQCQRISIILDKFEVNPNLSIEERVHNLINRYLDLKYELAKAEEVLARYESVFHDINSLVQKATE